MPTSVRQSRTCPSNQDSIDDSTNIIGPWEYDNPERNKADGCITSFNDDSDVRNAWNENTNDCQLPNAPLWMDVANRACAGDCKKSIQGNNRKSQILPEGKVFVFGSSSHPCLSGDCNAIDNDWRKTQPWDENAGCSWEEWVKDGINWDSDRREKCMSDINGLENGICPEG